MNYLQQIRKATKIGGWSYSDSQEESVRLILREFIKDCVGEEIEHFIDDKGAYIGKENYHNKYRSEILSKADTLIGEH